jgi:hypothetical protein
MRLIIVTQEPEPRAFGPYRSWKAAWVHADFLMLELDIPSVLMELEDRPGSSRQLSSRSCSNVGPPGRMAQPVVDLG